MKIRPELPLVVALLLGEFLGAQDRSLRFAWPVPSDVVVTEEHTKRGKTMVARYRIELRGSPEPGELLVRKRDFRFLELNGMDVTGAGFREMLAPLEAQMGILPDISIDVRGQILGIEGWDRYYERVEELLAALVKAGTLKEDLLEETLKLMRQPAMQEVMQVRAVEFWAAWVSMWLDHDFGDSAELEVQGEFPLPNGTVMTAPQKLTHHGPEAGRVGSVRLSMVSHLGGEEVRDAILAMMRQLNEGVPGAAPIPDGAVTKVDIHNRAWVVLRPDTMQPLESLVEKQMAVQAKDGNGEDVERRHYRFDWN